MRAPGLEGVSKFNIHFVFLSLIIQPVVRPDLQKSEVVLLHFLQVFCWCLALA